MFTYILPTVLVSPRMTRQLERVLAHQLIDEVILINNNNSIDFNFQHEKLKKYVPKEQLYCNGAWNYGVLNSSNENIILATDDIEYDTRVFDFVNQFDLKNLGPLYYNEKNNESYNNMMLELITPDKYHTLHGYGQIFFMHKDNFITIPDTIKHWYGDALQFHWNVFNNRIPNYITGNFVIHTNLSESQGFNKTSDRIQMDASWWEPKFPSINALMDHFAKYNGI